MASFLTFVGLELLCLFLIINKNSDQRDIYLETKSVWTNAIGGKFSSWTNYFGLRAAHDSISELNAELLEKLFNQEVATGLSLSPLIDSLLMDTAYTDQRYQLLPAKIVMKSPYSRNGNTFNINLGRQDGVEKGQGVISERGPIGIVTHVENHYSRVMTLLDPNSKVSACLANNVHGSLMWDGDDPRYSTLHYIPDYITHPGTNDTIYTTSYSNVYPTGIPIGRIESYTPQAGSGLWQISVKLFENLLAVDHAFVVVDLDKEELEALNAAAE
ncbi:MAG: rod shape-determining protein MreC [Bacteroidota bacterium]